MISNVMGVQVIRNSFIHELSNQRFTIDKTGVKTIELIGVSFIADEDNIFGTPNQNYIQRELDWYTSQSLYVVDIPGETPAIWNQVADSEGKINSNYGYLVFSEENNDQYGHVLAELKANPDSRRAIAIYTRPTIWSQYNSNGMSDFICTNAVQYLLRDGVLNAVVQMRSNDVVFGYRNDFAWQLYVLKKLARDIGVTYGEIIWQVGSLHVYEVDFWRVECWKYFNENLTKKEYQQRLLEQEDELVTNDGM